MKHLIIVLVFGFICSNISGQKNGKAALMDDMTTYQIGDKVEDFSLIDTEGKNISLSQFEDAKGYIIVFTSNVCPFAIASEDRLSQIHNEMSPKGYPVIAVNSNVGFEENLEAMKTRVSEENLPFIYLKDDQAIYAKFGAIKTPHVFLVDNTMILQYKGSIDDNPRSPENVEQRYLVNAIENLIKGRTPDPTETKSIGCPIKSGNVAVEDDQNRPRNSMDLLERMDANEDRKISKDEAKGPLAEDFERLDTNRDGVLTIGELSRGKPGVGKGH